MSNVATMTSAQALAIGDQVRAKALSYAAKTGTAVDLAVVSFADTKHEATLGPIKLYLAMKANLSAEEIDGLPMPGSKWNDKLPDGSNQPTPDIVQWKDPSKPDGKAKEISFYVVWADGTPEGARVVKELEWCSRAADDKMKKDDIPADWMKKYASSPVELRKRKIYLENRRGNVRKAYKDAVKLLWQLDMVNELDGCEAEIDEANGSIIVANKLKPRAEWKVMSVGAFTKLKPAKALETGGAYADLMLTAERGKKEAKATPANGVPAVNSIQTPETMDKVAVAFHNYLDKLMKDKAGSDYANLLKHLTGPGGAQSVHTLGSIRKELNALFRMDTIQSIYDREEQDTAKAA